MNTKQTATAVANGGDDHDDDHEHGEQKTQGEKGSTLDKELVYVPMGSTKKVRLTINIVRHQLCQPTKKGRWPDNIDVLRFMKVCENRMLDPWIGDAWLLGYDNDDGSATFEIITSIQALYKRAEINENYDGSESGIIVKTEDGEIVEREGDYREPGDVLLGAWARVHRKDRKFPSVERINLGVFDKGKARWKKDPAGMLTKCAEAGALRKAFPSDIGGLYIENEMGRHAADPARAITETGTKPDAQDELLSAHHQQQASTPAIEDARPAQELQSAWMRSFTEQLLEAKEAKDMEAINVLGEQLETGDTDVSESDVQAAARMLEAAAKELMN